MLAIDQLERMSKLNTFAKEVINFLDNKYSDAYEFKLERQYPSINPAYKLTIQYNNKYSVLVNESGMSSIYDLWSSKCFCGARNLYCWQKELVDIIEGC